MKNSLLAAPASTLPATLHVQAGHKSDRIKKAEIIVTATAVPRLDVPLANPWSEIGALFVLAAALMAHALRRFLRATGA